MRRLFLPIRTNNRLRRATAPRRPSRLRLHSLEDRAVPALIAVTSNADSGAGSFRDAVTQANTNGQNDVIEFQFGAPTSITLLSAVTVLEDSGLAGATLVIQKGAAFSAVTIDGNNATGLLVLDATYTGPTFAISAVNFTKGNTLGDGGAILANSTVTTTTLTDVSITNCAAGGTIGGGFVSAGNAVLNNCTVTGNKVTSTVDNTYGGGVAVITPSTLTLTNCTVTGNSLNTTAAAKYTYGANVFASGGLTMTGCTVTGGDGGTKGIGVGVYGAGVFNISNSTISGNIGGLTGSGIYTTSGDITIANCQINNNLASGNGGALRFGTTVGAKLIVSDTTFDANNGKSAGGTVWRSVVNATDTITFERCTFSNNISGNSGGVFSSNGAGSGTVTFNNSTFFNNSCAGNGGVVRTFGSFAGNLTFNNCTLVGNIAPSSGGGINLGGVAGGSVTLNSTIVSLNKAGGTINSANADLAANPGSPFAVNNSLIGAQPNAANVVITGVGNQIGTVATPLDPQLKALANNGGTTKTMIPASLASPVINKGSNPLGLTSDQRNDSVIFPRSFGGGVDVGAVEFNNPVPIVSAFSAPDVTVAGPTSYSFTVTFASNSGANIKASTLGAAGAITVTGPGGFSQNATLVGGYSDAPSIVATYSITAPGGTFGFEDNGTYTITVNASKISDTVGLFVPAGTVGTFKGAIGKSLVVDASNDEAVDTDGKTSLREALATANSAAFSGQDTITFDAGVFAGATSITVDAVLGDYLVSDSVVITGPAAALSLDGFGATQIMFISGPGSLNVSISNLTFVNGFISTTAFGDNGGAVRIADENVSFSNCVFSFNSAALDGGAVGQNGSGNLSFTNCTFNNNTTTLGSGGGVAQIAGGTLSVTGSTFTSNTSQTGTGGAALTLGNSSVTVSTTTFDANISSGDSSVAGGMLVSGNTKATFTSVTFKNNEQNNLAGGGAGGGFAVIGNATVTFDKSVFTGNKVGLGAGGGLWVRGDALASITINNSTFDANQATGTSTVGQTGGAGIWVGGNSTVTVNASTLSNNTTDTSGGGIAMTNGGQLTVSNSTLSGNTAAVDGGGVLLNNQAKANLIRNSTVAFNTATGGIGGGVAITGTPVGGGALTLSSTIVAKNTNAIGADVAASAATSVAGSNNLVQANTAGSITYTGTNPQNGLDPNLDATLALNGAAAGTPLTHALKAGSPAIDTGNNLASLATDQRGFVRTAGVATDIGAYEFGAGLAAPPTVASLKVNGGGDQRSMVFSVVVNFSEAVSFPSGIAAAFQLNRVGQPTGGPSTTAPLGAVNISAVQAGNQVTITFLSGGTVPIEASKSLIDGLYQLTIVAANVTGAGGNLDGDGNLTPGGDFVSPAPAYPAVVPNLIHRLFGDGASSPGDRDVDAVNFGQFRGAFGTADPTFDFDADGDVDSVDFGQFRQRFGATV